MRYRQVTERIGENMGPVDWSHATAKDMPKIWRDAERDPASHLFNGRELLAVCMYDGWPYWVPTPAVQFVGPLRCAEWTFFNSIGVSAASIKPKKEAA